MKIFFDIRTMNEVRVLRFHGTSKKQRLENLKKISRKGGILLTTYGTARSQKELLAQYPRKHWDYMVLDVSF